eukprot:TRINITY_DN64019_c0_g1_i1.p1 TRINITY_DN64019_c0_g1~~TRINITY_DN64019_c0_g1_i1.p1  ORF type:complete len:1914 (+),score=262.27 TRINITY_DN64019_c0_g1_i1:279-5744(+)
MEKTTDRSQWSPLRKRHGPAWALIPPAGVAPLINLGSFRKPYMIARSWVTDGPAESIDSADIYTVGLEAWDGLPYPADDDDLDGDDGLQVPEGPLGDHPELAPPDTDDADDINEPLTEVEPWNCQNLGAVRATPIVLWGDANATPAPLAGTCDVGGTGVIVTGKIVFIPLGHTHRCTVRRILTAIHAGAAGIIIASPTQCGGPTNGVDWGNSNEVPQKITLPVDPSDLWLLQQATTVPIIAVSCDYATKIRQIAAAAVLPATAQFRLKCSITRQLGLEGSVIAHEWGHLLANRLVGNAAGLTAPQARAIGEGTADLVGLLLMARNTPNDKRPELEGTIAVGRWTTGTWAGVHRFPYKYFGNDGGNLLTFEHIRMGATLPARPDVPNVVGADANMNDEPHAAGEVWGAMLWDVTVALVKKYDIEGISFALDKMESLLVAALQTMPVDPTFTEARDAFLLHADQDFDEVADAFRARGLGPRAVSPMRWDPKFQGLKQDFQTFGNPKAIRYTAAFATNGVHDCPEGPPQAAITDNNGDGAPNPGDAMGIKITLNRVNGDLSDGAYFKVYAESEGVMLSAEGQEPAAWLKIPIASTGATTEYNINAHLLVKTGMVDLVVQTPKTSPYDTHTWNGHDTHRWQIDLTYPVVSSGVDWRVANPDAAGAWRYASGWGYVIMPSGINPGSFQLVGPTIPKDQSSNDLYVEFEHKWNLGTGGHRFDAEPGMWKGDYGRVLLQTDGAPANAAAHFVTGSPNRWFTDGNTQQRVYAGGHSPDWPEWTTARLRIPRGSAGATSNLLFELVSNAFSSPDTKSHQVWKIRGLRYWWGDPGTPSEHPASHPNDNCNSASCGCSADNGPEAGCGQRMDGKCSGKCADGWKGDMCDEVQMNHAVDFGRWPAPTGWQAIQGTMGSMTWSLGEGGVYVPPGAGEKGNWLWYKPLQITTETSQLTYSIMSLTSAVQDINDGPMPKVEVYVSTDGPYVDSVSLWVIDTWMVSAKGTTITVDLAKWDRSTIWLGWKYSDNGNVNSGGAVLRDFEVSSAVVAKEAMVRLPFTRCKHGTPNGMTDQKCFDGPCTDLSYAGPWCSDKNTELLQDFTCKDGKEAEGWTFWQQYVPDCANPPCQRAGADYTGALECKVREEDSKLYCVFPAAKAWEARDSCWARHGRVTIVQNAEKNSWLAKTFGESIMPNNKDLAAGGKMGGAWVSAQYHSVPAPGWKTFLIDPTDTITTQGEPLSFQPFESNSHTAGSDCAVMVTDNQSGNMVWREYPCDSGTHYYPYICEWDSRGGVYEGWDVECDEGAAVSSITSTMLDTVTPWSKSAARWMITPPIRLTDGLNPARTLKFQFHVPRGFVAPGSFRVIVTKDGPYLDKLATGKTVYVYHGCGPMDMECKVQQSISLSAPGIGYQTGDTIYIAFKHDATTEEVIALDYVTVDGGQAVKARWPATACKHGLPTMNSDRACVVGSCQLNYEEPYCSTFKAVKHLERLELIAIEGTDHLNEQQQYWFRAMIAEITGLASDNVVVVNQFDLQEIDPQLTPTVGLWWRVVNIEEGVGAFQRVERVANLLAETLPDGTNARLTALSSAYNLNRVFKAVPTALRDAIRADASFTAYQEQGVKDPPTLSKDPWMNFWPKEAPLNAPINLTFTGFFFENRARGSEIWAKLADRKTLTCRGETTVTTMKNGQPVEMSQLTKISDLNKAVFTMPDAGPYTVCVKHRLDWVPLEGFLTAVPSTVDTKQMPLWGYPSCESYMAIDSNICGCFFSTPFAYESKTIFQPVGAATELFYDVNSKWNVNQGCCRYRTAQKDTYPFEENEDIKWGVCKLVAESR